MMTITTGINYGNPRLPYTPMTQAEKESLKKDLEEIGYFDWV